jgi:Na+-transporting methylmalonyl-CoA/oxaloacetate decarboxylase beta subunit
MRTLRGIVVGAVVLYLAILAGLFAVMKRPVLFGKVMSKVPEPLFMVVPFERLWFMARAGQLRPGDYAPDFQLWTSDKKSRVQLSSFRGHKPVVLIFGSYT